MKPKPVPTSPKVQKKEKVINEIYAPSDSQLFEKPRVRTRSGILFIVFAILAGFLAGLLGQAIFNALALAYPGLPLVSEFYFRTAGDDTRVIIQRNEKSMAAQEVEVEETLRRLSSAQVTIFPKKQGAGESSPMQSYNLKEASGLGTILTNDGLIMTTHNVIKDKNQEYVALTLEKELYSVQDIIFDHSTEAVFFRIDAQNLSVVEFIDPQDLRLGQDLLTVRNKEDGNFETVFTKLRDLHYFYQKDDTSLISSEFFPERFLVTEGIPTQFSGAPLATLDGKVIGIILKSDVSAPTTNLVLPSENVSPLITEILRKNALTRVFLGIRYLDLGKTIDLKEEFSQGKTEGALLFNDEDRGLLAVEEDSPAQKAGLKSGDLIIQIGETKIDQGHTVEGIIQGFEPLEKVKIIILRERKEITVAVQLEELK